MKIKIDQVKPFGCGPACLKIILQHYGLEWQNEKMKRVVSMDDLRRTALKYNFFAIGAEMNTESLYNVFLPCILHWNRRHFVVLFKIAKNNVIIADPAKGIKQCSIKILKKSWIGRRRTGFCLLVAPKGPRRISRDRFFEVR